MRRLTWEGEVFWLSVGVCCGAWVLLGLWWVL